MNTIYDFEVMTIDNEKKKLSSYRDKVLLIVNVASKCGFTPQYQELEALYQKYKDQGFVILGVPCNQFASQEPASNDAIQKFCSLNYGVSFPMFSKIDVNGKQSHPLYTFLKKEQKGFLGTQSIKWNFTKFLVSKEGTVVKRFAPFVKPLSLEDAIEALL